MPTSRRPGPLARRRAQRRAALRQQRWEEIRAQQQLYATPGSDHQPGDGSSQRPPPAGAARMPPLWAAPPPTGPDEQPGQPHGDEPPSRGSGGNQPLPADGTDTGMRPEVAADAPRPWFLRPVVSVLPVLAALAVAVTVAGGLPLIDGRWHWPTLVAAAAIVVVTVRWTVQAYAAGARRSLLPGLLAAALIVLALPLGIVGQSTLSGQVLLRGSELDQAVRAHDDALEAVAWMRDHQRLLRLPPEQAASMVDEYEDRIDEVLDIAAQWNPATTQDYPGVGFDAVYTEINRTAVLQADGLAAYRAHLENPEPALAAEAANAAERVEPRLGPSGLEQRIRQALADSATHLAD